MWASGHDGQIKRAAHGCAATREEAMAAFAKSWRGSAKPRPLRSGERRVNTSPPEVVQSDYVNSERGWWRGPN